MLQLFPSKNLGAYGDGGAIVTNDLRLYERICRLCNHGVHTDKFDHFLLGRNSRLDSIQAQVLKLKLPFLDEWNERRRMFANLYRTRLCHLDNVALPLDDPPELQSVYHVFAIRVPTDLRDALRQYLVNAGIETGIHYPRPIHLLPAFHHLGYAQGDFPIAEMVTRQLVSLPMHPFLSEAQIEFVCQKVADFLREQRS